MFLNIKLKVLNSIFNILKKMCSKELHLLFRLLTIISVLVICIDSNEKVTETYVNGKSEDGIKIPNKVRKSNILNLISPLKEREIFVGKKH